MISPDISCGNRPNFSMQIDRDIGSPGHGSQDRDVLWVKILKIRTHCETAKTPVLSIKLKLTKYATF